MREGTFGPLLSHGAVCLASHAHLAGIFEIYAGEWIVEECRSHGARNDSERGGRGRYGCSIPPVPDAKGPFGHL